MCSRSLLVITFASLVAACGGGGGGGPDHECFVPDDHGSVAFAAQVADGAGDPGAPDFIGLQGTMNDDALTDIFGLELYPTGALAAGIATGTYELGGDELNYETCGVCARIFTDCSADTGECEDLQYYVTGGTVTITSIGPNITGSVSDLTFEEVTIDATTFHSTPVEGGCTTEVGSASFDATITFQ